MRFHFSPCFTLGRKSPLCAPDNLFQRFVEVGTFILLLYPCCSTVFQLFIQQTCTEHDLCQGLGWGRPGREGSRNQTEEPECWLRSFRSQFGSEKPPRIPQAGSSPSVFPQPLFSLARQWSHSCTWWSMGVSGVRPDPLPPQGLGSPLSLLAVSPSSPAAQHHGFHTSSLPHLSSITSFLFSFISSSLSPLFSHTLLCHLPSFASLWDRL